MRAIIFTAVTALLGAAPAIATADESCRTVSDVLDYIRMADPAVDYRIYPGDDAPTSAVYFSRWRSDKLLVVRFKDGCANGHVQLTREQFEAWLAKKDAAQ